MPLFTILGIIIVCVLVWSGILFLVSLISGWRKMATVYPNQTGGEVLDKKYFVYARARRFLSYNGIIVLEITRMGLRIRLIPVVNICHPPIFIPWSELQYSLDISKSFFNWFFPSYPFWGMKFPQWRIKFYKSTAQWIVEKKQQFER